MKIRKSAKIGHRSRWPAGVRLGVAAGGLMGSSWAVPAADRESLAGTAVDM
jgi:hypothetical protein